MFQRVGCCKLQYGIGTLHKNLEWLAKVKCG